MIFLIKKTTQQKKDLLSLLGTNLVLEGKRTGFARSEEVGIPGTTGAQLRGVSGGGPDGPLRGAGGSLQPPFRKQTSKESTDSNHSDKFVSRLLFADPQQSTIFF